MYKVKQLYIPYEDEDGHKYLVPEQYYHAFDQAVSDILDYLFEEDERFFGDFEDILDLYSVKTLEGDAHYIVLPMDISE